MKGVSITPRHVLLIISLGIAMMVFVPFIINPLRWPNKILRSYILKLTPIGTDMDDVFKVIEERKKWEISNINNEWGYLQPGPPLTNCPLDPITGQSVIGEKSIRALVGRYTFVLDTYVTVYWGFDANDKLIDVYVLKERDVI